MNATYKKWILGLATACVLSLSPVVLAQSSLFDVNPGGKLPAMGDDAKDIVKLNARFTPPAGTEPAMLFITAEIKQGWHIYSITQEPGGPIRTKIQLAQSPQYRLAGEFQAQPPPKKEKDPDAFGELSIETHYGSVTWCAPLEFAQGVDPAGLRIGGKVSYQACDASSCLPPTDVAFTALQGKGVEMPVEKMAFGLWIKLGWAFLGGLILNIMPCVLPVISLKIFSFLQQAGEHRSRVFVLNLWYSLGLMAVFMVLAALAATAGWAWGEQFTLPWFKVLMTALVFVMALSFLGVWEIPIPGFVGSGKASEIQAREGPSGAFFKGAFATILATPCSGPFLGPVFGYLLQEPPYMAYLIFGAVGLGMASPYLVIGAFPELIRFLPKPGRWMETVQQLMAFLLLATVVYLFSTLNATYFIPTLALLIGLWFACWWIGRTPLTAATQTRVAAWVGGTLVAALVGWFAFAAFFHQPKIAWQPFSPQALAQARADGKTVMVDFSADWCLTCKTNLKLAIDTDTVYELIKANGVVPMLADWTDQSPTIKKALNDLHCNSIPQLAIWPANSQSSNAIVLSDLLSESQVLKALNDAGPSK
ncbi:MAG: cytochrome c biogenesis protein CcdA [Thermoguttaceae bacterium]|jgi:thiol:disulfide interchange protein